MSSKIKDIIEGEKKLENVTFTKTQLYSSKKYRDRKDLINVLLKNEESYSFSEVDDLIKEFMKGKVN